MKGITGVIIGAVIVVGAVLGTLWYQQSQNTEGEHKGTLYVGITDAAAGISEVNDIELTVKKVEIYNATEGWVSVSSSDKAYKLLTLDATNKTELYAKADVAAGMYDRVRVTLGDVIVKTKSKGDVKATTPSPYVVADMMIKVNERANTFVKLDVLADQSLHVTSSGNYVFAAVVASEAKSDAQVVVAGDNSMIVSGGTVNGSVTVGVDLSGVSRAGFRLVTDNTLNVESSLTGAVKFILGGKEYTESSSASGEASGSLNAQGSSNTDTSGGVTASTSVKVNGGVNLGY